CPRGKPLPNTLCHKAEGASQTASVNNEVIRTTNSSAVLSTARLSRSWERTRAEKVNMLLTTDHDNMYTTRPTRAMVAYTPASVAEKKCFTRIMSRLLIITWPTKNTMACTPSSRVAGNPACASVASSRPGFATKYANTMEATTAAITPVTPSPAWISNNAPISLTTTSKTKFPA